MSWKQFVRVLLVVAVMLVVIMVAYGAYQWAIGAGAIALGAGISNQRQKRLQALKDEEARSRMIDIVKERARRAQEQEEEDAEEAGAEIEDMTDTQKIELGEELLGGD